MEKPKVFDVFSGAGGFSLGFEMAGCEIIGAIEHDKWATDTFSHNHPNAVMMLGDIESFSEDYLRVNLKEKPDIIIGGPPCQGFSICTKNAGDPKDPRNSLFTEFIRMAQIFDPSVMVMENAIANMITNGESQIDKVVAVMPDGRVGPPCGACREYMMQLDKDSGNIEILLDLETEKTVLLKELIPNWWGADRFAESGEKYE